MRRFIFLFLLSLTVGFTNAQHSTNVRVESKKSFKEQEIRPFKVEVTFDKTVHIIFPAKVVYVDLGSNQIIAGKADGTENVIRVKAAVEEFEGDTNFSVICDDGSFFSFNARYAKQPAKLNIIMSSSGSSYLPSETVYFSELGKESPSEVKNIMNTILKENRKLLRHLGSKQQKIQLTLRSIHVNNSMFYFLLKVKNSSQVPYDVDYVSFKIADKEHPKRTPIQERVVEAVRSEPDLVSIKGKSNQSAVYALPIFTLSKDQVLLIELIEKNGGRHQKIQVEHSDVTDARVIQILTTI